MKLLGQATSGNCWKVRLMLGFLGQDFEYESVDTLRGGTREAWFLKINPAGKIPCLVINETTSVVESNAILWRLAQGTPWWPEDMEAQTRIMSWLFWEQYSHEPALAVARSWKVYRGWDLERPQDFAGLIERSYEALALMESQLSQSDWLATSAPTIADISLFPYTALFAEAGGSLAAYPAVKAWVARFKGLPGYGPIEDLPASA